MGTTGGLIAIVASIAILFFCRPKNGVERPFVRNWMALVGVTMVVMMLFVAGIAAIITNWS
jgi:hypothetical protein